MDNRRERIAAFLQLASEELEVATGLIESASRERLWVQALDAIFRFAPARSGCPGGAYSGDAMQIVIDIPEQYLLDHTAESLTDRFRLYTALMMFRLDQISAGAACELAGIDRYSFHEACKQHQIPVVKYSPDELAAEARWLGEKLSGSS